MAQIFPTGRERWANTHFPKVQTKTYTDEQVDNPFTEHPVNDITINTIKNGYADNTYITSNAIEHDHVEDISSQIANLVMQEMSNRIERMERSIIEQLALDRSTINNDKAVEGAPNPRAATASAEAWYSMWKQQKKEAYQAARHDHHATASVGDMCWDANDSMVAFDGQQWIQQQFQQWHTTEPAESQTKIEDPFGE